MTILGINGQLHYVGGCLFLDRIQSAKGSISDNLAPSSSNFYASFAPQFHNQSNTDETQTAKLDVKSKIHAKETAIPKTGYETCAFI
jgi:hypothetical protein